MRPMPTTRRSGDCCGCRTVDRFGSVSFVAALEAPQREALLAELREIAGDGTVTLGYRTEVDVFTRKD